MLTHSLRVPFFALFTIALVGAHCGGKIDNTITPDKDAGLNAPDGSIAGDDTGTGDDASGDDAFGDDAGTSPTGECPLQTTLLTLGATCNWVGECKILLDACDTGEGTITPSVCSGGAVNLPAGEGISCVGTTGHGDDSSDDTGDDSGCAGECYSTCDGDEDCVASCETACEGDDAGQPPEGCAVGAMCSSGTCTNSGAGPCGSDQRLGCKNGVYVANGFPCDGSPESSCGFGSTGPNSCSESCECVNGLETCTGNCDGGLGGQ